MIALAAQIRILFLIGLVGLALWLLWRVWQRASADPRIRRLLSGTALRLMLIYALRRGLPVLLRLLRVIR